MNSDVEFIIRMVQKEAWARKRLVMFLYFATSLLFAGVAWVWPQVFTSTATIIVEDKNIIRPLMEGTAVTTALAEPSRMATQILSSRNTLGKIIQKDNWLEDDATEKEIDLLMDAMRSKTEVRSMGRNILEISYRDGDAMRAYRTAKRMSEIFVDQSQFIKQRESRAAYEFINAQAEIYHKKLKDADKAIKEFRSKNIDSTPGAEQIANERILDLSRQIEELDIEITGEQSKLKAQQAQLSGGGGAENSASIAREATLRERVASLKIQLEDLRLIYKDTYPDIVQILSQIESTEQDIDQEIRSRSADVETKKDEHGDSAVTRELNSQILATKTNISTLRSRQTQLQLLLDKERDKVNRIKAVEVEINELTRDSEVNQAKYSELLEQRESARISMDMDIANQGIVMRIQESAFIPVNPKGIRFIHLIAAGLVMSFLIPLGVVYGLAILDQKVRDPRVIAETMDLPVLASVYPVKTQAERRIQTFKVASILLIVGISWSIYAYEIWLRTQG